MYRVEVSSEAEEILYQNFKTYMDEKGTSGAKKFVNAFDECIEKLKDNPFIGCRRLPNIPKKYYFHLLWKNLWLVIQISKTEHLVTVDYVIDDRKQYGDFEN